MGVSMTKEQRFLLDNNLNDLVNNRFELDYTEWVYTSDIIRLWELHREKYNQLTEADDITDEK
jgi:hypothetical protein